MLERSRGWVDGAVLRRSRESGQEPDSHLRQHLGNFPNFTQREDCKEKCFAFANSPVHLTSPIGKWDLETGLYRVTTIFQPVGPASSGSVALPFDALGPPILRAPSGDRKAQLHNLKLEAIRG